MRILICFFAFLCPSLSALAQSQEDVQEAEEIFEGTGQPRPGVIRALRKGVDDRRRAAVEELKFNAVPVSETVDYSFTSAAHHVPAQIIQYQPTAIIYYDITGKEWPIDAVVGGKGRFDIARPRPDGNQLIVMPTHSHNSGTIQIFLNGLSEPIPLRLSYANAVDPRWHEKLKVMVKRRGPNAKPLTIRKSAALASFADVNRDYLRFFDPVVPDDARPLTLLGPVEARGWSYNERLVILTTSVLLSPPSSQMQEAGDGRRLYVLNPFDLLVFEKQGTLVEVSVNE